MADDTRKSIVELEVREKGADKAAKAVANVGNSAKVLDKDLDRISKDIRSGFDSAAVSIDKTADSLRDAGKAADDYESRIKRIKEGGADFSGDVASSSAGLRGAVDVFSGGNGGAVSDLLEVGEALADVGEFAPLAATQLGTLVANLGPVGIGLAAVAAVAAIAVAGLAAEQQKAADAIEAELEAQRSLREKLNSGATTQDLIADLDELREAREREAQAVEDNTKRYQDEFTDEGFVDFRAFSADEQKLADDIETSRKAVVDYDAQIVELEAAIKSNAAATNDAAEAEKKLAEERTQATLDSAAAAGQEIAAKRRADDASYEQNQARINAIDDERAALEAQLSVLQASGDTSEAVAGQIEKLTGQLGALGGEADYIKNTALEASKQRDAEKKAIKEAEASREKAAREAEQAAQKSAAAQETYSKAIADAGRTFKQATEDINTKLKQGLADNLTSLFRDSADMAESFRRDTFDQDIKAQQSEREALIGHYRDVEDIRDDALKSESEALRDGDFKQAFLARQAGIEAVRNEERDTARERQDRQRAAMDERADFLRNNQRERTDRQQAYKRQNADLRTNAARELQAASTNKQRQLAMAQESYSSELRQLSQFYQQRNQIMAQANQQALQGMGGGATGAIGRPSSTPGSQYARIQRAYDINNVIRK
jgi:hypothetical protein